VTDTGTAALKFTVAVLLIIVSVWPTAKADQPATPPRIGVLDPSGSTAWAEGFRDGLSLAGYSVGRNLTLEWRRTAETEVELQSAVSDLVHSRIGLIVTTGSSATRAALQNTSLPVVFLGGDPVAAGFASSLAKPGGRATGVSAVTPELSVKQLELLHQLAPKARRVGFLASLSNPLASRQLTSLQAAARTLGVRLEVFDASNTRELDVALHTLEQNPPEALMVPMYVFYLSHTNAIVRSLHVRIGSSLLRKWSDLARAQ
jgi:putative tryptophan/tyrosine transport system substrate-binding protein